MMVLLILLAANAVLLLFIVLMLATGWPLKLRDEIERLGNGLRREMAEQKSESHQFMKSIRIVVEDAVRESVEKEMATARPRTGRPRKSASSKKQENAEAEPVSGSVTSEEESDNSSQLSLLQAMQIPLFAGQQSTAAVVTVPQPDPAGQRSEKDPDETIHMGYVDDIPDVE
jgi:uncharacterized iron-regulated membrane protein